MNQHSRLRTMGMIALLPALVLLFWLTAVVTSALPQTGLMAVNVHGLSSNGPSYGTLRPAPLSLSVLADAQNDSTRQPTPSATAPVIVPTRRPVSSPTPAATTAAPSPTSAPSPTAAASPTPTPVPTGPTPSPTAPIVLPSATPVTTFGSLKGTVVDAVTQAPIVGATVLLSGGMARVTGLDGSFSFSLVLTGNYSVTVSMPGYVTQTQSVTVRTGKTTSIKIQLSQ